MGKAIGYLIATAYLKLIDAKSLKEKLHLLSVIISFTKSALKWADKPREDLKKIEEDLKKLWRAYEYALEGADYAFEKRCIFESRFYNLLQRITIIVENFEVMDASVVQEVHAIRWRQQ